MIDEEKRLQVVFSTVELAHGMCEMGFPKTAYSKILRETIHFVWEIRELPKHSKLRIRSKAASGLKPSDLDYDHAVPMRIVIDIILTEWPDRRKVEWVLRNMVRGILITKDEHRELRKHKLASSMPEDWDGQDWTARYRVAGIELADQEGIKAQ